MVVYKITFPNGKVYIGQTIEKISTRISHHKTDAKLERDKTSFAPRGSKICNAIRKYDLDFNWVEIIDTANSLEDLNLKEAYWVSHYNSDKTGYNIKPGGGNKRHSESTKVLIGKASKERWKNQETAERMLNGLKKGVEAMKARKGERRVPRIKVTCPMCETIIETIPSRPRKFCSRKCSAKNASEIAAKK